MGGRRPTCSGGGSWGSSVCGGAGCTGLSRAAPLADAAEWNWGGPVALWVTAGGCSACWDVTFVGFVGAGGTELSRAAFSRNIPSFSRSFLLPVADEAA